MRVCVFSNLDKNLSRLTRKRKLLLRNYAQNWGLVGREFYARQKVLSTQKPLALLLFIYLSRLWLTADWTNIERACCVCILGMCLLFNQLICRFGLLKQGTDLLR
jgi:hypothetical protein